MRPSCPSKVHDAPQGQPTTSLEKAISVTVIDTRPGALDDRGKRRVFLMLALLAADGPLTRAELLERTERLVPMTPEESERPSGEHSVGRRRITRAYETLRNRGLLVDRPADQKWTLTEAGQTAVTDAAGSYLAFWRDPAMAEDPGAPQPDAFAYALAPRSRREPLNQILFGPPGTGKTFSTVDAALMCLRDEKAPAALGAAAPSREERLTAFRFHKEAGRIEFVTFHQAFSYEDFVEGYRPVVAADEDVAGDHTATAGQGGGAMRYERKPGVFKAVVERAIANPQTPYVLIIDEINRGNVAGIFGELITLIEEDKRIGSLEELRVTLPYSSEPFGVPENLYIIGTMNTADRSLAGVDLALRRRFEFVEMPPRPDELAGVVVEGVDVAALMKTLNERIQSLKGRDFAVGHAFFLRLKGLGEQARLEHLAAVFSGKVIPLLKEYFFEDDRQIAAALGQSEQRANAWDYLERDRTAPVSGGQVLWRENLSALQGVEFYHQVAGTTPPASLGRLNAQDSGSDEQTDPLTPNRPGEGGEDGTSTSDAASGNLPTEEDLASGSGS